MSGSFFPRFSPDGSRITHEDGDIQQWQNQWLDDREIHHNGVNLVIAGEVTAFPAGSEVAAGGGRWAASVAAPPFPIYRSWTDEPLLGAGSPAINPDGRFAYVDDYAGATKGLILDGQEIDRGAITNGSVRMSRTALVWTKGGRTWGYRLDQVRASGIATDIQVAPIEFRPIPIDGPDGPWVLNHTHTGFIVRPLGDRMGYRFDNGGQTYYPDGFISNKILNVIFTDEHGEFGEVPFGLGEPREDLRVPVAAPIPPPKKPPMTLRPDRFWFLPNIASPDLVRLFDDPAVLTDVGVFQFYTQQILDNGRSVTGPNTFANLSANHVFQKLQAAGIATAMEGGALSDLEAVTKIRAQGGDVHYFSISEPLVAKTPIASVVEVIKATKALGVKAGWIEAFSAHLLPAMQTFLDALIAAGATPDYWHLDLDRKGAARDHKDVAAFVRDAKAAAVKAGVPLGIILWGDDTRTDAEYVADTLTFAKQVKAMVPVDHLLVQSWATRTGGIQDIPANLGPTGLLSALHQTVQLFDAAPVPVPIPVPPTVPPVPPVGAVRVFLRLGPHYLGVPPGQSDVHTDAVRAGEWEMVELTPRDDEYFDARFVAANRQLAMAPNGLTTTPAGTAGLWERPRATTQPDGTNFLYRIENGRLVTPVLTIEEA